MIYLRITDLLLSPNIDHISTDWQVAEDLKFTNVKVESIADTTNLTSIRFDVALDPKVKYYARARVLLSTGYTAWSNIDIFTPEDVEDPNFDIPNPSIVTIPSITVTNNGVDVPIFGTKVTLAPISTIGGATHTSTTYILEDLDGNNIWISEFDVEDKHEKEIPPGVLIPNTIYRLKVIAYTDSRDSSQIATKTIKTESSHPSLIFSELVEVSPDQDLTIEIDPNEDVSDVVGKLYTIINNDVYHVDTQNGGGALGKIITFSSDKLRPLTKYILRVDTNDPTKWDQRIFWTTA